jgi:hypothetical protein
MKSLRSLLIATVVTMAPAIAVQAAGTTVVPPNAPGYGTIPAGSYPNPCKSNPKACGEGYDLTKPHIPQTPPMPKPQTPK